MALSLEMKLCVSEKKVLMYLDKIIILNKLTIEAIILKKGMIIKLKFIGCMIKHD